MTKVEPVVTLGPKVIAVVVPDTRVEPIVLPGVVTLGVEPEAPVLAVDTSPPVVVDPEDPVDVEPRIPVVVDPPGKVTNGVVSEISVELTVIPEEVVSCGAVDEIPKRIW